MNGAEGSNAGDDRSPLGPRASDADRKRYITRLQEAAGEGFIDLDELGDRISQVYGAKTIGELELVVDDLPSTTPPVPATTPEKLTALDSPAFRSHLTMYLLVIAFLIGIWVMTGAGFFWPFFPAAGWGIGIGAHWQAADQTARKKNRGHELSDKEYKAWADEDPRARRDRIRAERRDGRTERDRSGHRDRDRHERHRDDEVRTRADRLKADARERATNVADQATKRAMEAAERAAKKGLDAVDRALPGPAAAPPIPPMPPRPEAQSAQSSPPAAEPVVPPASVPPAAAPAAATGSGPTPEASGPRGTPTHPTPSGEADKLADALSRRFVAAAFVDIVGSTSLNEALGDEGYAQVRRRFRSLVEDCASAQGGVEANTMGDGVLVRFDHPAHAARAAVEIMRRLDSQRVATGFAPSVRVGIHSGDAMEDDGDIIGAVVNLAARVTAAAGKDEIWCTEHVADHVSSTSKPVGRGLHTLKGMAQPRHLLAIEWR